MYDSNEHPDFAPLNDDLILWRYMDVPKFLSLIEDNGLFFARADLMTDPWEGSTGPRNAAIRPELYGEHYAAMGPRMQHARKQMRTQVYLNCWHASSHESAAMWGLYQSSGQGVAVRTKWKALKECLQGEYPIRGGAVRYVDYTSAPISEGSVFGPFMHKRNSFAHENEVRLVLWAIEDRGPRGQSTAGDEQVQQEVDPPSGYVIPIDPSVLTSDIYVAPEAPTWYANLIKKVIDRYSLNWEVHQSDLSVDPVW
jgi:hypothetical protein